MLQLGLHLRANPHQLVAMNQQLPQILLFPGRSPDPRKPSLQQQLQNQRGIAPVVLLLPHIRSANLRRIADPNIVSCRRAHFHKPLAAPARLHSNQTWPRQSTVKLLRFSRRMFQFLFSGLSSRRVQPTNLLPTGVVITSNKHHRRLLPTEFASVLQPEAYSATERSLRSYPINPLVLRFSKGAEFDFSPLTLRRPNSIAPEPLLSYPVSSTPLFSSPCKIFRTSNSNSLNTSTIKVFEKQCNQC